MWKNQGWADFRMNMPIKRVSAFWLGLAVLVVIAAVLRVMTTNFSLPFVDHPDEPVFYQQARVWRGQFDLNGYLDNYPPVFIATNVVAQWLLEAVGQTGLSVTVHALRLLSAVANVLTLVFIALSARCIAGDLAGWIAGAAWAVAPSVVLPGVYATPDPLVYLWVSLALWLGIEAALDPRRERWCVWSFAVGVLAILTKYPVLTAVAPGGLVALAVLRRDRRRGLRYLAIQGLMGVALVVFLLFLYPISNVQREGETAREQGLTNILNPNRVLDNLYFAIYPLEPIAFELLVGGGVIAWLFAWRTRLPRAKTWGIGLAALLLVTIPWLAASFSAVTANSRLKDVLPATTAACVLLGAAAAQIVFIVPERWKKPGMLLVPLPLVALVFVPQLKQSWDTARASLLPDSRVALRQWADINLDPGTVIVDISNDKTFNPFWGGLLGRKWFDWWTTKNVMEYSLDEWHNQRGMSYAVIPQDEWAAMQDSSDGQAYLAHMLHLKDFTAPPQEARGPEFVVYRLWRMQVESDLHFGDAIRLVGYDHSTQQVKPGDSFTLRLYWQASSRPATDYSLFVHLTPLDAPSPLAQIDGAPAVPERPAPTWDSPNETLISPSFTLTLPADLPAGTYRVLIGLYDYHTNVRLPISDGKTGTALGDSFEIAQVTVGK